MRTTTLAAMVILAGSFTAPAQAAESAKPGETFLKLTHEQRYWWIHGAATTTAHLIAMHDKTKGDCAAKWFLDNREAKQKLLEDSLALNPAELPTTILLALMTRACGGLVAR